MEGRDFLRAFREWSWFELLLLCVFGGVGGSCLVGGDWGMVGEMGMKGWESGERKGKERKGKERYRFCSYIFRTSLGFPNPERKV